MGIINAPDRGGRLPGERAAARGGAGPATAINAADATPLSQERIESAPKPAPKATNTDDEDNADDTPDQPVNATAPAKAADAAKPPPSVTTAPPPDAPAPTAPPPEEPPH
jgi:NADH-quinone oxidoreductase subunit I